MFICPTCQAEYNNEDLMRLHFLSCWKEKHPYHKSKSAPHSDDIVTKEVSNDIMDFFKGLNNGRS